MSALRKQLLETADSYVANYNARGVDFSGIVAGRTPDCAHRLLPARATGGLVLSNDDYLPFSKRLLAVMPNLTLIPAAPALVDEEARSVVLHIRAKADLPVGGPYEGEYLFILRMTDDGTLLREVTEFVDSANTAELLQKFGLLAVLGKLDK